MQRKGNRLRQNGCALLAAVIWGSAFVAQSVGAEFVEPFSFNAARSAVAFIFLLTLCALRRAVAGREARVWADGVRGGASGPRELAVAALSCGTALTVASYLQQKGMETTSSGKAGFITALYIVMVPVLSIFLRKKPPAMIWISVALAVAGLYLLCVTEELTISEGDGYVLLCALCFSVQILTVDRFSARVDGVELSCFQFFVVTVLSALGAAVSGEHPTAAALRLCAGPILYAGVLSSGVAYTLQILAQKDANPTVISLLMSLESVFATLSGALVLHERLSAREYAGCALMLTAVVLAQLPGREKAAAA